MENKREDDDLSSSMANHSSGSRDECSAASGESGWTAYIDYFTETQQHHKEGSSAHAPRSSDGIGDHGAGGTTAAPFVEASRLPALVDSSEASKRLDLRRKKLMYDESLEDTATSPISSPKLINSRGSDDKHKNKKDTCDDISHSKKTTDESYWDNRNDGAKLSTDMIGDEEFGRNELRKKGLCLVPVTVFRL